MKLTEIIEPYLDKNDAWMSLLTFALCLSGFIVFFFMSHDLKFSIIIYILSFFLNIIVILLNRFIFLQKISIYINAFIYDEYRRIKEEKPNSKKKK